MTCSVLFLPGGWGVGVKGHATLWEAGGAITAEVADLPTAAKKKTPLALLP